MIYTVVFNSLQHQSMPTANNRGTVLYGIDWSFLPQGKKYKVTFSFNCKKGTYTADNALQIYIDFTGSPNVYQANGIIQQSRSNFLGLLFPDMVSATTDVHFIATPHDNPPIMITDRPSNNVVTIRILDNTGASFNLAVDYILVVNFEEVSGGGREVIDSRLLN